MADAVLEHRTYGNWRRVQSVGLFGLGLAGTVLLFAGLVLTVIAMMLSLWLALACAVVLGAALAPLLVRDAHGRNLLQRAAARLSWAKGRAAGQHLYRSGPLSRVPKGKCSLPGVLAQMTATEAKDAYGRPFALLVHPWVGHASVVLTCAPDGAALVDEATVDSWVAHWGAWLAALANEPGLVGVEVVVESAPGSAVRLRQEVYGHMAPDAHPLSVAVMREAVEAAPVGSASITCRIALTWSMASRAEGAKRRGADEMALEIGQRLPALASALAATGAGPARAMTVAEVAAAVRVAYDPAVAELVEDLGPEAAGTDWADAGPVGGQEAWDHYRHDGAVSVSWVMTEAPRGQVFSSVLSSLLAPHPDIARKRVALAYRPYGTAAAVRVVESDRRDAIFAASGRRAGRARDALSVKAAERSAEEEATGAGVVRFAMVVTATVTDAAGLGLASSAVGTLAATARVRLRKAVGAQSATFAASLPLGLVTSAHLRAPQALREAM
ncbi:MAG: SCO6880 family protein [Acidimicrobiales bacterium]